MKMSPLAEQMNKLIEVYAPSSHTYDVFMINSNKTMAAVQGCLLHDISAIVECV